MKAFKYIFFLILITVIGFSTYIAVQPNAFMVTRTHTIKAPASVIYNNVIDFKNWEAWSSWAESDSDFKISLSEQTKGVNGTYFWEDKNGVGTLTTTEATPYERIRQSMQMSDLPPSEVNWNFKDNTDGSTNVTWSMSRNDLSFGFKMKSLLFGDMEKQIGPHYERSLEKLDSMVVNSMKTYSIEINGFTEHSGGYYIYNSASCKINNLKENINTLLPKVKQYAVDHGINVSGFPFIYYNKYDEENNAVMFSCCLPTNSRVITTQDDILTGKLEPFKTLKTTLKGNHTNLPEAWEMSMTYISNSNNEMADNGPMLETFVKDSSSAVNPAEWITEIYIALKN